MKKIGIDMTHYGKMSGYGIVATNIINGLLLSDEYQFYLLSREIKRLPNNLNDKKNVHWVLSNVKSYYFYRLWTQASLLKNYNIDVFYTPDQIVPLRKVCKYISTIHDLYGRKNFRGLKSLKLYDKKTMLYHLISLDEVFAKKSDFVITPSVASKDDILHEFNLENTKIVLGHWGMNHIDIETDKFEKKDYILFPLCADCDNHFIFRLGNKIIENGYAKKIIYWKPQNDIGKLPVLYDKRTELLLRRISDNEKNKLISEAKLSIYISEMEGFGFVPLECQSYGCPVIYHKVGSLDEVIGNTGIGIDGLEIKDYLYNVNHLINDYDFYKKIINSGTENVKSFKRDEIIYKIEQKLC